MRAAQQGAYLGAPVEGEPPKAGKELEEREHHHKNGDRELDGRHHVRLAAERVAEERRDVRQEPEQHGADDRPHRRGGAKRSTTVQSAFRPTSTSLKRLLAR